MATEISGAGHKAALQLINYSRQRAGTGRVHRTELAIIKVSADKESRSEIMQIVNIFRAKIIDVSHRSMIIEVTGDRRRSMPWFNCYASRHKGNGRTGKVSMVRARG